MKKPLTAALLVAATVGTLAAPAGAAMPSSNRVPLDARFPCSLGDTTTWSVWRRYSTDRPSGPGPATHTLGAAWANSKGPDPIIRLAADNQCTRPDDWVRILAPQGIGSKGTVRLVYLAPGAHFNWPRPRIAQLGIAAAPHSHDGSGASGSGGIPASLICQYHIGQVLMVYSYKDVRPAPICTPTSYDTEALNALPS